MKRMYALLSAIMMAAAIALPSRAETNMAFKPAAQDTLIMKLKNNSQVLVVVKDLKDLKSIKNMNLDSLVDLLDKHTTEIERAGQASSNKPVTITVDGGSGKQSESINITIMQDTNEGRQVIKKEIKNVKIDVSVEGDDDESTLKVNVGKSKDEDKDKDKKEKARNPKSEMDFQMDFGVSTWVNKKMQPGSSLEEVDFKEFKSRYVAFNSKWSNRLGGAESPLRLHSGFTLDFHNYMFDDNVMLVNSEGRANFIKDDARSLEKSKLATSTVTIPLELGLDFRNQAGKSVFRIGGGGFAGYMIGSHTKLKYSEGGDTRKTKVKDDFYLNNFQYGLTGFIGIRSLEIFAKYNLNEMFEENRGPQANALAVGVRLMKF